MLIAKSVGGGGKGAGIVILLDKGFSIYFDRNWNVFPNFQAYMTWIFFDKSISPKNRRIRIKFDETETAFKSGIKLASFYVITYYI